MDHERRDIRLRLSVTFLLLLQFASNVKATGAAVPLAYAAHGYAGYAPYAHGYLGGLVAHPNGAVVPVDEPAVQAAKAEHFAAKAEHFAAKGLPAVAVFFTYGGSGGSGGGLGAKCFDAYDCNELNPCCAGVGAAVGEDQFGTCGTDASGHCGGAVTIDRPGQDVPRLPKTCPPPPESCGGGVRGSLARVSSRRRPYAGLGTRFSVFNALGPIPIGRR